VNYFPPLVLAFDFGTTGCKGVLVDSEGTVINRVAESYPSISLRGGQLEQNPVDWWEAAKRITSKIKKTDAESLDGIGFCGTMAAALPVSRAGQPLRNAMLYADMRATKQADSLASRFCTKDVYSLTGNPLSPAYSLAKWMWIREEEPRIFEKTYRFIQPKDYLVFRATEEILTDYVDASATMAFDVKKCKWAEELLDAAKIPVEKMPEPHVSTSIVGELTGQAAVELGLKRGIPVIAGCGDTAALLAGASIIRNGDGTIYLGAAAEIDLNTDKPFLNKKTMVPVRCHAIPDMWFTSASAMTSGTALRWFVKQLCSKTESYEEMDKKASKIPPGSDNLIFLPYLSGERMPIWDPKARGVFIGISMATTKTHFYRSMLEGVAYSLRSIMETLKDAGAAFKKMSISGGGASSRLWKQIVIDVLGFECSELKQPGEVSALGLAACIDAAIEGDRKLVETQKRFVKAHNTMRIDHENKVTYDKFYHIYKECYPALAKIMHSLAG
jgi:xylulokinase